MWYAKISFPVTIQSIIVHSMDCLRALCISFLLFWTPVKAAAPVTHVYLAELWMKAYGIEEPTDQKAFIAGALFPDIRYLGTISRGNTHEKGVTARKIRNTKNPFTAGKRLHAFVDVKREKFVKKSKIFSRLKMIPKKHRVQFLKLLEDEILWNLTNCSLSQQSLEVIYLEELDAGVEYHIVLEWHQSLINYFHQRPSEFLYRFAEAHQGFLNADANTVAEWSRLLPLFSADPLFIEYTEMLVSNLEKLFAQ